MTSEATKRRGRPRKEETEIREIDEHMRLSLRGGVLPHHTYPGQDVDLEAMRRFHAVLGVPPAGFLRRLWWRLTGPGGAS
jgi:hypothetical protein